MTKNHTQSIARWIALSALIALLTPAVSGAETPNPAVSGPVKATGLPGVAAHDYPFFASNHDLASHGYVEEEFFIEGTANRYNTPAQTTATVIDKDHPYKTRIVVRRPADPKRFNGTVLVEWYNVTNNFDAENMWFFAWEQMLRAGYAWVGVSTQQAGVVALKTFSAERYGTIDVNRGGTVMADALSFDIFSQAGQAIKNPKGVDVLGGLKPSHVLAIGESQSANRLSTYVNSINPLAGVYDGFMLLSSLNQKIRTDTPVPVWKISAEYDVAKRRSECPSTRHESLSIVGDRGNLPRGSASSREPGTPGTAGYRNLVGSRDVASLRRAHRRDAHSDALRHRQRAGSDGAMGGEENTSPECASAHDLFNRQARLSSARDNQGLALGGIRLGGCRGSNWRQQRHQHGPGRVRALGLLPGV